MIVRVLLLVALAVLLAVPVGADTFHVTGGIAFDSNIGFILENFAMLSGPGLNVRVQGIGSAPGTGIWNDLATGSTFLSFGDGTFNQFSLGFGGPGVPGGSLRLNFTHAPVTVLANITDVDDLRARSAAGLSESAPFTMTGVFTPRGDSGVAPINVFGEGILRAYWEQSSPTIPVGTFSVDYRFNVPEPSTLVLLFVAGIVCLARVARIRIRAR